MKNKSNSEFLIGVEIEETALSATQDVMIAKAE